MEGRGGGCLIDYDSFDSSNGLALDASRLEEANDGDRAVWSEGFFQRENRRIRNSASFRVGVALVQAVIRPWKLLLLPLSLPYLVYCIGMERLGRRRVPHQPVQGKMNKQEVRDCVVLFPTNGVGFGHFTRMFALARRWKKISPDTEIIFFTTMPTLHLLYTEGFPTYHLSGRQKSKNMTTAAWNALLEEQLSLVFSQHKPSLFVFDGAFPYRGMLNAIRPLLNTRKVWLRRGSFKKGSNIPVDSIEHFDLIVRPDDSVPAEPSEIKHSVETISVPPMVLLEPSELLSRQEARKRLRLPMEDFVVYVQLGAGRINDIDSEIRLTIDALLEHEHVTVVLGESMLGERLIFDVDRVVLLRDYPNAIYFKGFDAAIQAGGYNSYHETRKYGLPTVFYPNMSTGMDDQLARCKVAEQEGWGKVVEHRTNQNIREAVHSLLSITTRSFEEEEDGATILQSILEQRVFS